MIKKTEIMKNVFLLEFDNNIELGSTMLRFQEFYESPKFNGRFFTFDEYRKWYTDDGKKDFTYYTDWTGFNIPSFVLKPFFEGDFDPLSNYEKKLLSLFSSIKTKFYIIAVSRESSCLLDHEIAHALYYTNDDYRKKVDNVLSRYDIEKIKNEIRSTGGYCEKVLQDEIHAWVMDDFHGLKTEIPENMRSELKKIFSRFKELKKNET